MRKLELFEKEKGDVKGAAEVVKDLQVETFGSVERRQKTEYIIEQMRVTSFKTLRIHCARKVFQKAVQFLVDGQFCISC